MSIQRFEGATVPDGNGRYVLYADHVQAVAEAEQRVWQAAREAVAAAQAEAGDINFCKDCADWSVAAIDALKEKP